MAEEKESKSRILLPNATFMDAHGDIRVEPSFQNVVLSLTGASAALIEARWDELERKAKGAKKAKKVADEPTKDGAPVPGPAPPVPIAFAEKAVEVFRFDPRIATQQDCIGGTIGGKPVDSIPSGRKAGLAHKGHCGLAWEDHSGELSISMLTEEGRGLTIVDVENGELAFQAIPSLMVARTQKAKGLSALHAGQSGLSVAGFVLAQDWPQLLSAWRLLRGMTKEPIFVRACPVRPRHGFVDSRVIASEQALMDLYNETLAADPLGEWLLGELIAAEANIVGTPMAVSVGKGHDGATAGVDAITLPLANPLGMRLCDMPEATREKARSPSPRCPMWKW